jgi:phage tail tube protein FII
MKSLASFVEQMLINAKAWAKGQLISKCFFGFFNSPKKQTKTIQHEVTIVAKSIFFVELKVSKRHFEIN